MNIEEAVNRAKVLRERLREAEKLTQLLDQRKPWDREVKIWVENPQDSGSLAQQSCEAVLPKRIALAALCGALQADEQELGLLQKVFDQAEESLAGLLPGKVSSEGELG